MKKSCFVWCLCAIFFCLSLKTICLADYPDRGFVVSFPHQEKEVLLVDTSLEMALRRRGESRQFHTFSEGHDLSGLDLRDAHIHLELGELHNINFDNANLERADLRETMFKNCSFRNANLRYAELSDTIMPCCDLTDADITGAVCVLTPEQIKSTWNYKNKDFSNICFLGIDFSGMELRGEFDFNGTVFSKGGYPVGRFDNCDITDADLRTLPHYFCTTAQQAFTTKNFKEKNLAGIELHNIDFSDCDFSNFTLGGFINCKFDNATFTDARFADPRQVNSRTYTEWNGNRVGFINSNITKEQFEQTKTWKHKNLRGMFFEEMNLEGWDFSNTCIRETSFRNSSVKEASFHDAVFSYNIGDSELTKRRTDFKGTKNLSIEQWESMRTLFETP